VAANPAAAAPAPVRTARPLQTAYGVTIISTENSGGGLPSLGIFSNEHIYTVYLDMRKSETDTAPSWTLEFAVSQSADTHGSENPGRVQQGLVLPFPVLKEHPALPAEVVRKYLRRMMIVYAVINVEGKMEQIAVKESPDPLLNEPLLGALSKWSFRPARVHGVPAPARVLLGIPLWLPQ
jgi:hypothetical protein